MKREKKTEGLNIRITGKLKQAVKELAESQGVTVSAVAVQLLVAELAKRNISWR